MATRGLISLANAGQTPDEEMGDGPPADTSSADPSAGEGSQNASAAASTFGDAANHFAAKAMSAYAAGDKEQGDLNYRYALGYYAAQSRAQASAKAAEAARPRYTLPERAAGEPHHSLGGNMAFGLYGTLVGGPSAMASAVTGNNDIADAAFNYADALRENGLRLPDAYNLTATGAAGTLLKPLVKAGLKAAGLPAWADQAGAGLSVTIDRDGTMYGGPAFAVGRKTAGGLGASAVWLNQPQKPTSAELQGNLGGAGYSASIGAGPSAGTAWSPGAGTMTTLGLATRGVNAVRSYAYQLNHKDGEP